MKLKELLRDMEVLGMDANPELKPMYSADDGNCEVLYLKDATAQFCSFGGAPKIVKF